MSAMIQLVAAGLVVEVLGVIGFVVVAGTTFAVPGKTIALALFCIAMLALLSLAESRFKFGRLIQFAAFMAIGVVAVYQALGFLRFPGLVKDVELFSAEHLRISFVALVVSFLACLGGIFLVRGTKKVVGLSHREAR